MATTNPNVDAIIGYVEEHNVPLLGKSVLGAVAPKYFSLMTGVKGKTALNIMDADPTLQSGKECGFDAENDTTFTQREMNAVPFKVNMSFCDKNLLDTWANYEVKVAAGLKSMPFEEDWTNQIVDRVQEQLEKYIWQGGSIGGETIDGIAKIVEDDGVKIVGDENTDIYPQLVDMFQKLPAAVQAANDVMIFTTHSLYNKLVQEILSASHYHLDVTNYEEGIVLPGTRVKVVPTVGLVGANALAVIGRAKNFYYGTDMRGDSEKFDLWYSKDNREFRLAIEFVAGAQVAFPDEAIVLTKA